VERILNKLRVGVVGVGYLGKFHAEKYAQMDHVDLIGIVDLNKSQAEEIARKLFTKTYTNHQDLFGKVDAVSVAVPTPIHFAVAKDFLENNVDVLIENPITTTLEEADELIRIAESKNLIIQVGHIERFNPVVVALEDLVEQPRFIESHRLSIYKERCTDVSVVLDLMIHDIDMILNFVGYGIKNIHAAGIPLISKHTDIANARLEFENGCVANVTASRISTKDERKIRLFQSNAYISVDFVNQKTTVIRKEEQDHNGLIPGTKIQQQCLTKGDALRDELNSFVTAVIDRKAPKVTGRMGRDALKIALNIMEQIHNTNSRFL
jgi:predicted dehydrogenase